jgi:hypothetical protein
MGRGHKVQGACERGCKQGGAAATVTGTVTVRVDIVSNALLGYMTSKSGQIFVRRGYGGASCQRHAELQGAWAPSECHETPGSMLWEASAVSSRHPRGLKDCLVIGGLRHSRPHWPGHGHCHCIFILATHPEGTCSTNPKPCARGSAFC